MEAPVLISILVFLLTMVLLLGLASYLRLLQVRRLWTERLEGKRRTVPEVRRGDNREEIAFDR